MLKGHQSLIAHGDNLWLCQAGNPGMASAGMGDVLAGVVGGLWAQGVAHPQVALLGVWLHAAAGDAAAQEHGEHGVLASDLFAPLQSLMRGMAQTP